MPSDSIHHRQKSRKYNIVIVPSDDAGKTASFHVRPLILVILAAVLFLFTGAITFALLNYTPLALILPVTNPALEEKYGRKIAAMQETLARVTSDVLVLQEYNSKLRKVLGGDTTQQAGTKDNNAAQQDQRAGIPVEDERLPVVSPEQTQAAQTVPRRTGGPVDYGTGTVSLPLSFPIGGFITRGFDPANRHYGIDIAGRLGSPISAAADGHVIYAGWTVDDGNVVILAHANGFVTFYKHNQAVLVGSNTKVKRGEPVALLGNSGRTSRGPHLHFEVWLNGMPRDPNDFIVNAHL